ncbi:MAG: DNA-directed RNA polymerase subunit omega [Ndongobacter sp.]|nr:DNA-directed RNA polymerase subunit omega [Ndongobacter sp.]
MINPSFKELSEISPSRYEICVMVMKRARRLVDHSEPKVLSRAAKPVTLALDEIMAGQVVKQSEAEE